MVSTWNPIVSPTPKKLFKFQCFFSTWKIIPFAAFERIIETYSSKWISSSCFKPRAKNMSRTSSSVHEIDISFSARCNSSQSSVPELSWSNNWNFFCIICIICVSDNLSAVFPNTGMLNCPFQLSHSVHASSLRLSSLFVQSPVHPSIFSEQSPTWQSPPRLSPFLFPAILMVISK